MGLINVLPLIALSKGVDARDGVTTSTFELYRDGGVEVVDEWTSSPESSPLTSTGTVCETFPK